MMALWFFRYEVRLPLLHPADKRFALRLSRTWTGR
jgi:hypothetical protein